MADYSKDILSAYNDIKGAGVSLTINREATGTYIPNLGITAYATAELNADIDNAVTTLTMKNESGTFYDTGDIYIDRELMTYAAVSTSDLTGLTRGVEVTDAIPHLEDSDIYLVAQDTAYSTYGLITVFSLMEMNQSTIKMGDKKLLIPSYGLSITPTVRDIITINSVDFMIVTINQLQPNNTDILYTCHIRGV